MPLLPQARMFDDEAFLHQLFDGATRWAQEHGIREGDPYSLQLIMEGLPPITAANITRRRGQNWLRVTTTDGQLVAFNAERVIAFVIARAPEPVPGRAPTGFAMPAFDEGSD